MVWKACPLLSGFVLSCQGLVELSGILFASNRSIFYDIVFPNWHWCPLLSSRVHNCHAEILPDG